MCAVPAAFDNLASYFALRVQLPRPPVFLLLLCDVVVLVCVAVRGSFAWGGVVCARFDAMCGPGHAVTPSYFAERAQLPLPLSFLACGNIVFTFVRVASFC
jgi:hypothetical protein